MSKASTGNSSGIGFTGLLTIVFIACKLTGYISWSWWWVLAPLWLPLTIILGIYAIAALIVSILDIVASKR